MRGRENKEEEEEEEGGQVYQHLSGPASLHTEGLGLIPGAPWPA